MSLTTYFEHCAVGFLEQNFTEQVGGQSVYENVMNNNQCQLYMWMHVIFLSWCSFTYRFLHYVCSWAYSSQSEDKEPSHTALSQVHMFHHFGIHRYPIYRTVHRMLLLFHRPLYRLSLADMKCQYKGYQHL